MRSNTSALAGMPMGPQGGMMMGPGMPGPGMPGVPGPQAPPGGTKKAAIPAWLRDEVARRGAKAAPSGRPGAPWHHLQRSGHRSSLGSGAALSVVLSDAVTPGGGTGLPVCLVLHRKAAVCV